MNMKRWHFIQTKCYTDRQIMIKKLMFDKYSTIKSEGTKVVGDSVEWVQTASCSLKTDDCCKALSTCWRLTLHWSVVNCHSVVKSMMTWSSLLVSCWPLTLTSWPLSSVSVSSSDLSESNSALRVYTAGTLITLTLTLAMSRSPNTNLTESGTVSEIRWIIKIRSRRI